uniref:cytochrome c oxidase subunit III n=1 Tax=Paradiplozoon yunnanensis TaxID=2268894 RepID=UPI001FB02840|nr:cytochrome c oxidase subunit III [Paradiplozoon yunnanensis]UKP90076.1 cytochrome c oxidase subunit III [Paradiplozoon yunnanensis]
MYSVFPIFFSFFLSVLLFLSFVIQNVSGWFLFLFFLVFCFLGALFMLFELNIWCNFSEVVTSQWIKLFVVGEFILFLSLMLPVVYLSQEFVFVDSLSDSSGIPLLGLYVLLLSSFCVNEFERCVEDYEFNLFESFDFLLECDFEIVKWLGLTLLNGFIFLLLQYVEFCMCPSSVLSGAWYASCLVLVSFHGTHVIIGMGFLICCYFFLFEVKDDSFNGLEKTVDQFRLVYFACFYWHFVDLIWFIVYFLVYFFPGM